MGLQDDWDALGRINQEFPQDMPIPQGKYCTVHQVVTPEGHAKVHGSEVRLPSGEVIPGVSKVVAEAQAGSDLWTVTIQITASFGEPIR